LLQGHVELNTWVAWISNNTNGQLAELMKATVIGHWGRNGGLNSGCLLALGRLSCSSAE
tara:strand:+ start:111 stop:287 length:177 start_codon:yes stop_codon:yes gene_type:complete